jgi:hypothetical protein
MLSPVPMTRLIVRLRVNDKDVFVNPGRQRYSLRRW